MTFDYKKYINNMEETALRAAYSKLFLINPTRSEANMPEEFTLVMSVPTENVAGQHAPDNACLFMSLSGKMIFRAGGHTWLLEFVRVTFDRVGTIGYVFEVYRLHDPDPGLPIRHDFDAEERAGKE